MRLPLSLRIARKTAISFDVRTLLAGALANPKVAKSADAAGVLTAPMHFAPAKSSGEINVCVFAGICESLCLDEAGNPAYANGKRKARKARTIFYARQRQAFLTVLVAEVAGHILAARRARMECAVRLNATSDILWERLPVTIDEDLAAYLSARTGDTFAAGTYPNVMSLFPGVAWYDYTKIPPKHRKNLPANYHLTYSYDPQNDPQHIRDALALGWNVAVPFQVKKGRDLPATVTLAGLTLPVFDADLHDFRPADPKGGHVAGLRFKRITGAKARALGAAAATGAGFALAA